MHAFRFGVTHAGPPDLASWTATAKRVESLGYDTFLVPDTLNTLAPLPALGVAAAVTSTLRVGTWVLCDPLRNPRSVAWEIGSLSRMTGGRVELGLGAGRPTAGEDARRLGLPFSTGAERANRLRESVPLIRGLLDGVEPDFPSAGHRVPILIAASGPRLLEFAAQAADIIAFGWPPDTDENLARSVVDRVVAAAGDRADEIELAAGLIAVGNEQHPWLQRMGVDPAALAAAGAVTVITGSPREIADTLLHRRDRLGVSYVTVPSASAEAFAPVVELLAGS
ncbi:MAG TPA: LLM class flavin-dependent oxidoreductase [Jatrophihabitans sp.]|nr:LLM class flavin-dependent oxidoreductase [Jatrophihabitans sp.]